jgi:hypothetical protein
MAVRSMPATFPAVGPLGRFCACMCIALAIFGAVAELALIWVWLSPALVQRFVAPALGLQGVTVDASATARLAGFAIMMLPMAALGYVLGKAYRLFDFYRLGILFPAEAPRLLRCMGRGMLAIAALRPMAQLLLGYALTASNEPGQVIFALRLSIEDIMIALFGGLLIAIGHVMAEARRIAAENESFV